MRHCGRAPRHHLCAARLGLGLGVAHPRHRAWALERLPVCGRARRSTERHELNGARRLRLDVHDRALLRRARATEQRLGSPFVQQLVVIDYELACELGLALVVSAPQEECFGASPSASGPAVPFVR
eukprot:Amastigsp_a668_28.p6 type:complete len:126 gc:universal Amastigsp_a668_28:1523-1900(+)